MMQPIILCGGKGSRLWPLSREMHPKQYLPLNDTRTLYQNALERSTAIGSVQPPLTICNVEHRFIVSEQMRQLGINGDILIEPVGRDTAPAVTAGALLHQKDDPVLLVMPADHAIPDQKAFRQTIRSAESLAKQGYLVTFGIPPTRPDTGYGYLRTGEPVGCAQVVTSFEEKPNQETACKYLDSGEYLWNSGIFLFRASTFLAELERFAPDILRACEQALAQSKLELGFRLLNETCFAQSPALSVDYAVMEKTDKCVVVRFDSDWNDLGTWLSLYETSEQDTSENALYGDVIVQDSANCLVRSESRLLALVGLSDIVAVETKDAVLVCHKSKIHQVKDIVTELGSQGRCEVLMHKKVYRPWGAYETMDNGNRFQVKRITVEPGASLSLQLHHHRAEHWVVAQGTAKVTKGDDVMIITENQSAYINIGEIHRLENPGKIALELIEIQTGAYLGEDDIVRLDDVYGRNNEDECLSFSNIEP